MRTSLHASELGAWNVPWDDGCKGMTVHVLVGIIEVGAASVVLLSDASKCKEYRAHVWGCQKQYWAH